jgi:hypothetical protein
VAALVAALMPATAHAWGEVAQRLMARGAVATCLRSAGDGELLSLAGRLEGRHTPIDLLQTGSPLALAGVTDLGQLGSCPATAQGSDGTLVVAGAASSKTGEGEVRAAVRPAGGPEVTSVLRAAAAIGDDPSVAAAVSSTGDVLVAWTEQRDRPGDVVLSRLVVSTSRAGHPFGPPQPITQWVTGTEYYDSAISAAADRTGRFTLAWLLPTGTAHGGASALYSATGRAGGAFSPPQSVDRSLDLDTTAIDLAVAPDGGAILAYSDGFELWVVERLPTEAAFGVPVTYGAVGGTVGDVAVGLRDGGGAVVVWQGGSEGVGQGVVAMLREQAGPFRRPQFIVRAASPPSNGGVLVDTIEVTPGHPHVPYDPEAGRLRVRVAPDGRVAFAWVASRRLKGGDSVPQAYAASGTLAGAVGPITRLGGPCRPANGVAAGFSVGGDPQMAWTDNFGAELTDVSIAASAGQGVLHLARPGAPQALPSPRPRIRLHAKRQRLFPSQPAKVTVTCDRACDLRGASPRSQRATGGFGTGRLRHAGKTVLSVDPGYSFRRGPAPRVRHVGVNACVPRGNTSSFSTLDVPVTPRPPFPTPKPLDVRVTRRGRSLIITWHTAEPARRALFGLVMWDRSRGFVNDLGRGSLEGRGRTRFRLVAKPEELHSVRFVELYAISVDTSDQVKRVRIPVHF